MKSIDELREFFSADRFATENGAVIDEVGENYAKCSMRITPSHRNALGNVMGGASFTLADFAFAVAANCCGPGTVSLASNITFYGKAKGDMLTAEARCIKDGRSTCYYRIDITDELGTQVAAVTTNGFKTIQK